ncbi:cytochrome c oxidase subunit II [Qipengyuania gelatinilytica]|uniref:Cytochrome c oxidase subunit 2 n=1 Tax=Qipengyuania gelatinilytica TaxID=2867231 RepID=A0ABX9A7Z2_9SPHN|nr:cytochrome c oxidase subunit II [Qipengyuania gelatinilytica]
MKTLGFHRIVASLALAFSLVIGTPAAMAQDAIEAAQLESVDPADAANPDAVSEGSGGYEAMAPTEGKGMPIPGGWDVQAQYSETGETAYTLHHGLIWVMAAISVFVLVLMLYTVFRFRQSANPVPSKTSHNTLIEVVWTVVPALILLVIAVPSITLIAKQYETPPKDAITIKAIGYQWYWGYAYPDNGDFEIVSNMLSAEEADARGEPHQLAVDNRMVVPAGVPIRLQVTAADVIHSFAVPSLWFKMDAVPGRLNERIFEVDEPGVYYGQCSELCGARHGYMPIAVEALPMDEYNAWVLAQGGSIKGAGDDLAVEDAESAADAAAAGDAEGVTEAAAAE